METLGDYWRQNWIFKDLDGVGITTFVPVDMTAADYDGDWHLMWELAELDLKRIQSENYHKKGFLETELISDDERVDLTIWTFVAPHMQNFIHNFRLGYLCDIRGYPDIAHTIACLETELNRDVIQGDIAKFIDKQTDPKLKSLKTILMHRRMCGHSDRGGYIRDWNKEPEYA